MYRVVATHVGDLRSVCKQIPGCREGGLVLPARVWQLRAVGKCCCNMLLPTILHVLHGTELQAASQTGSVWLGGLMARKAL
jgi:hypothetical protein